MEQQILPPTDNLFRTAFRRRATVLQVPGLHDLVALQVLSFRSGVCCSGHARSCSSGSARPCCFFMDDRIYDRIFERICTLLPHSKAFPVPPSLEFLLLLLSRLLRSSWPRPQDPTALQVSTLVCRPRQCSSGSVLQVPVLKTQLHNNDPPQIFPVRRLRLLRS